jgi:hypothetical protein
VPARRAIGTALLALLAGCGRIDLPADGVISCGSDGSCPSGMSCSGGRCYAGTPSGDATVAPDAAGPQNLVFVTSTEQAGGDLGGLSGADSICNDRAAAAGLPGTYVAWLSTATTDAIDRLGDARGWKRVDGQPFADSTAKLAAGEVYYPPNLTETGARLTVASPTSSVRVITATAADGTHDGGGTCTEYTDTGTGSIGNGDASGGTGRFTSSGQSTTCALAAHLLCFGVDYQEPVIVNKASGRRAFVSSVWDPGDGLPDADAKCNADADGAGLDGTYRALLTTTENPAESRFDVAGDNFVRLDGVPLAPSVGAFFAGQLDAALSIRADGSYGDDRVWTGSATSEGGLDELGSDVTCGNWTTTETTDYGATSTSGRGNSTFFSRRVLARCDATDGSAALYCLER